MVARVAAAALVTLGAALTVLSAFYVSSFLAILGLALVFWGCILLYVAPTRQVPFELLEAAADVGAGGIERVLAELDVSGRGVYLPPKNLRDIESSLVFIPFSSAAAELPAPPEAASEMPVEVVPPPPEASLELAPEVAVEPVLPEPEVSVEREPEVAAEAVEPVPVVPFEVAPAPVFAGEVVKPKAELDLARLVEEALADLESIGAAALKELEEL